MYKILVHLANYYHTQLSTTSEIVSYDTKAAADIAYNNLTKGFEKQNIIAVTIIKLYEDL